DAVANEVGRAATEALAWENVQHVGDGRGDEGPEGFREAEGGESVAKARANGAVGAFGEALRLRRVGSGLRDGHAEAREDRAQLGSVILGAVVAVEGRDAAIMGEYRGNVTGDLGIL